MAGPVGSAVWDDLTYPTPFVALVNILVQ